MKIYWEQTDFDRADLEAARNVSLTGQDVFMLHSALAYVAKEGWFVRVPEDERPALLDKISDTLAKLA